MRLQVVIYGLVGGVLITILKLIEYRFLIYGHSLAIYGGLIAATFALLGIWIGLKVAGPRAQQKREPVAVPATELSTRESAKRDDLSVTRREMEVLELISKGLSNREIADALHVSENTIKTHSSRLFEKLGAKRRTQAVQLGKQFGLLS